MAVLAVTCRGGQPPRAAPKRCCGVVPGKRHRCGGTNSGNLAHADVYLAAGQSSRHTSMTSRSRAAPIKAQGVAHEKPLAKADDPAPKAQPGFFELAFSVGRASKTLSLTAKFLIVQGLTYFAIGLFFIFWPQLAAHMLHAPMTLSSPETLGMFSYAGTHIGTIGFWYVVSARSMAAFFPPATVFLRLVWVTSVQAYLCHGGHIDGSLAAFSAIGDVILAILTYLAWRIEGGPDKAR